MKIRICEKCKRKIEGGYSSCPYCGSTIIEEYNVEEKGKQKHCNFCNKDFDFGYNTCPYCGSKKVELIKDEEEIIEPKEENIEDVEENKVFISSNICENCGNRFSSSKEICPYCGSKNTLNVNIPDKEIYDSKKVDEEFKKKHQKRRERNEYLKGFYVGSDTDIISHEILKGKKLGKKFKEGMSDGLEARVIYVLICAVIGLIVAVVGIILHMK